jgi:hypothetical protein
MQTCGDEITLYDRPHLSVVQVTREGLPCYLLRIRQGASRSMVRAAMAALAVKASQRGQRVMADPSVTEIEFVERLAAA